MRLNSKVTWGLAWAGLAVIVAVPSADFITGKLGGDGSKAAILTSDVEPVKTSTAGTTEIPVKTSAVTTVKTKNGVKIIPAGSTPADPVDKLLGDGKPLPDYISDGTTPKQVASLDPAPVAPTPFPVWARPKFQPPAVAPTVTVAPDGTTQPAPAAIADPAPIVDETTLTGSISDPARPIPPAAIVDDSANWDTESLQQYLDRNQLSSDSGRSSARVTERSSDYDADGFYLSDGPNGQRETRRERLRRLFEESGGEPDDFTLF
jgi:hypothetical protein